MAEITSLNELDGQLRAVVQNPNHLGEFKQLPEGWPSSVPGPVVINASDENNYILTLGVLDEAGNSQKHLLFYDPDMPGGFLLMPQEQWTALYAAELLPITAQIIDKVNPLTGEQVSGYSDTKLFTKDGEVRSADQMGLRDFFGFGETQGVRQAFVSTLENDPSRLRVDILLDEDESTPS